MGGASKSSIRRPSAAAVATLANERPIPTSENERASARWQSAHSRSATYPAPAGPLVGAVAGAGATGGSAAPRAAPGRGTRTTASSPPARRSAERVGIGRIPMLPRARSEAFRDINP